MLSDSAKAELLSVSPIGKTCGEHTELFYFLSWRDIVVRNKQTGIGIAWALIQLFLTMVVFIVLIVPASAVIVSFVDFLIDGISLLAQMAWYNFILDWQSMTLQLFIIIAFAASMGAGVWLAALNLNYRNLLFKWGPRACLIL